MSWARLRSSAISSLSASQDSIKYLTSIRMAPSDTCRVSACCYAVSALASKVLISCSVISVLNSRNSLTSRSAYTTQSYDCVILPLVILSESCCSNNLNLARRVIFSSMPDAKLARRVSISSPTNLICSGGGGTTAGDGDGSGDGDTDGGSDSEGDLDLLQDEDGKSDGGGEDDDGKSDGGDDDDGKSGGGDVGISFPGQREKARLVGKGQVGSEWTTDVEAV
ncbi:hypothetical protein Tco_0124321 [Tanacetum coccineum]